MGQKNAGNLRIDACLREVQCWRGRQGLPPRLTALSRATSRDEPANAEHAGKGAGDANMTVEKR